MAELAIVLTIIALLTVGVVSLYSTDRAKATKLMTDLAKMKGALVSASSDLGGYPNRLDVLWLRTNATGANMFNDQAATTTWNGPYMEPKKTNAAAIPQITFSDVGNDTTAVGIEREAASAENAAQNAYVYFLSVKNVPTNVLTEASKICSPGGGSAGAATFANSTCRVSGTSFEFRVADSN